MSSLAVKLWGRTIGAVNWPDGATEAVFQYTPDYVRDGLAISPLRMPLRAAAYRFPELARSNTFTGLPGLLADSLPEKYGNRLMDRWLAKRGLRLDQLNPVQRLAYVGSRGMGALEFAPAEAMPDIESDLVVGELADLAQCIMVAGEHEQAAPDDLDQVVQVGTSAGGAKAKAVIAMSPDRERVVPGNRDWPSDYSHWILKFSDTQNEETDADRHIGRIEMAYHRLAVRCGITMTQCELLPDRDLMHFMTRRFDCVDGQRLHVQTFAGLTHQDRDPPGNTSYESLFTCARAMCLGQLALDELYRRMVFNIAMRNQDDHVKNHAFLMYQDGGWELSPAYDLCFAYKRGFALHRHAPDAVQRQTRWLHPGRPARGRQGR